MTKTRKMSRKARAWAESVRKIRFYCGGCGSLFSEVTGKTAREFAANPELVRMKERGLEAGHSRVCGLCVVNHEFVTGRSK